MKRLESLDAVTPDKFPRPDFSKYVSYKPEPATDIGVGEKSLPGQPPLMPERASMPDLSALIPDLPEPIMRLLGLLPPSIQYSGPRLPYEDIFALLLQSPIPLPPGILPPPPSLMSVGPPLMMHNAPMPMQQQQQQMMPLGSNIGGLGLAPPPTLTPMIGQPPIMQPMPMPMGAGLDNGLVKKPRIDPRKRKATEAQGGAAGADVKRLA